MNKHVFRKASLEQLSTPDKLDMLITITRPPHWIALLSIFLLIIATLIWSITAQLQIKISGEGVFTTSGGVVQVVTTFEGQLTDLSIEPGDKVERGETIARIYDPTWIENDLQSLPISSLLEQMKVVSMQRGTVLAVHYEVGEWLKSGEAVIDLQTGDPLKDLEMVVYMPLQKAQLIKNGTSVRVYPNGDRSSENGAILGTVLHVSSNPVDSDQMLRVTNNMNVVERFIAQGSLAEIRIGLQTERSHSTGLKWTAPKADSNFVIQPGSLSTVDFLIQKIKPIEWLF
ncbi:HlyD family efflux transporter periplasmic adaptor subunit [Bacillus sp. Marseille-P3661]|uniref:HlyD family efflux transporter periplasmic adaptor subunit n=1 Tax=Bacillus sp. Marseille-P3661 TaxID=1936234 RepID=UPI0015E1911E|nr:HlyD family efflux transporter periplasmic adaptor subunit [Bacillus sp. Marseille-P3661]